LLECDDALLDVGHCRFAFDTLVRWERRHDIT
jgi:hypothetical protein